ncbi:MAG: CheR family methyltransferase [Candidatus Eisenbacteria bacterium]
MALSSQLRHIVFPKWRRHPALNLSPAFSTSGLETCSEPELSVEHATFFRWLFAAAGLDHRGYRSETLLRRLPACLRLLRAVSTSHARQLIEASPPLLGPSIGVMLVGVTSFFRDPEVFDWLAREGLQVRPGNRPGLYVWSAGCSDGAELYSVALLLHAAGQLRDAYLLGSDCRSEAIQRARLGSYDESAVRGVPAPLLEQCFQPQGSRWQVAGAIRRQVRWSQSDLLKGIEPGTWDLILCRNTAMYLRPPALAELWARIEAALRPGGLLVLGRAERPTGVKRLVAVRPSIFRRVRG